MTDMKQVHEIGTIATKKFSLRDWFLDLFRRFISFFKRFRYRREPHPDIEVRHVENQEELIKWLRVNAKLMTPIHSFYRGIALGLGLAIGTGFVLSLLIHLLTKLALIPLIGDFAKQILDYLEMTNSGGG
jgi:hypothetical protein